MKLLFILLIISLNSFANFRYAPKDYIIGTKKMTFIDVEKAIYKLHIKTNGTIDVKTTIDFKTQGEGNPLFDLVATVDKASLNGIQVNVVTIKDQDLPSKDTHTMKYMDFNVEKGGTHQAVLTHNLDKSFNVEIVKGGIDFLFKLCDGKGIRRLLERYMPANLQYDQYGMEFHISFEKSLGEHTIVANGRTYYDQKTETTIIKMPKFYNSGAPFLHIFPKGRYSINTKIINGVAVTLYTGALNQVFSLEKWFSRVQDKLGQLERELGKWPHKFMILFLGESFSGIEHVGASRTSWYSLSHELLHMYYGRGAMPASGRSAWIDEGIARWRDGGSYHQVFKGWAFEPYKTYVELPEKFKGLGERSRYMRTTYDYSETNGTALSLLKMKREIVFDADPYHEGAVFFGHIESLTGGEFSRFLKTFYQDFHGKLYSQEDFFNSFYQHLRKSDVGESIIGLIQKKARNWFGVSTEEN